MICLYLSPALGLVNQLLVGLLHHQILQTPSARNPCLTSAVY